MDSHRRTIAKTITWRAIATASTAGFTWILTGQARLAASVGVLDALFKLVAYYGHERLWNRVDSGRQAAPES